MLSKIHSDIWRLVAIECLDDCRTLFNMLLVDKALFQTVVPVLYNNLPNNIDSFRNAQRLDWLLGFSGGLYTADKLPMTAKEGDQSWFAFTNPLTADYYSFVKVIDENWLLKPHTGGWVCRSRDEAEDVRTARLQKLAKDSQLWTDWVEFHAEKIQSLTLTPMGSWTAALDLCRINKIVHRFKNLQHVRMWPFTLKFDLVDPYEWEDDLELINEFCQPLIRFVAAHRALFPGLLAQSGIKIVESELSTAGTRLYTELLTGNMDSRNLSRIMSIDLRALPIEMSWIKELSVQAATSLNLNSEQPTKPWILPAILQRCGPQLEILTVEHYGDDWLAWARTTPEEEKRALDRKQWQTTVQIYRRWNRTLSLLLHSTIPDDYIVPQIHRPLFPKLKTLTIKGFRLIPVMDALSIFRNSLQTVNVESMVTLDLKGRLSFGWFWELPKLRSLKVHGVNLHFDTILPEFCPNLRILDICTYNRQSDRRVSAKAQEALKALHLLEELSLSDQGDEPYGPANEYIHDRWKMTTANGFDFPRLRKVELYGRWAVWTQGGFLAVAPRLETFTSNAAEKGPAKTLNVTTFFGFRDSENTKASQLSTLVRPFMRHMEFKHWTVKEGHDGIFEQIFIPVDISADGPPQKAIDTLDALCPRLCKVDLQYISGIDPNNLVRRLMRHQPEIQWLRVHACGELDLTKDSFLPRWDPSVAPPQKIPQTMAEKVAKNKAWMDERLNGSAAKAAEQEDNLLNDSVPEVVREKQMSFSGLHSLVGQCVLHYNGVQYVLR